MHRAVHIMALGIFAMVTSEFAVAGLMPQIAEGLGVTVPQVGYLVTAFAAAMAAGGPFLTVALLRVNPKTALTALFAVFLAGNVLAAVAPGYGVMTVARVITGAASQAFFGISISLCLRLARPEARGRAVAAAMNGLMLGTLLGMPLSTLIGERLGWRAAFWAVGVLTVIAALATLAGVPRLERAGDGGNLRSELAAFRAPRLWLTLSTSTFIIGATFAAFTYFTPVLTGVTGFAAGTVPLLLVAYGAATVAGNVVVGRLADRHTLAVLFCGLVLNLVFLTGFALLAHLPVPAVTFMMGIGLAGVTLNAAMTARVQRAGNAGPLVNTVHTSFITLGVIIGSWAGGLGVDVFGLRAPLWLGAALAAIGIATLVPDLLRRRRPALSDAPREGARTDGDLLSEAVS
ncbi:MFS transporter [Streptosporangium sandarakinum]|uniref:Putative MFS family arabinose efflux permease n=1 Tax=Streptosporangium sandarakinum TaxID=1260955 RepID=A0A852UZ05_9ACTN|nr:MFS transporter [Streptosporangium sandarakinum]NYF39061.1 putative MFS family arabinose efflux permease [Streptosporangium sandarakinum]